MLEHREQSMSALSHLPQNWHQIDWCRVQRTVRAMQIRIAKACKNSNWRKVKALQRMLTRSTSARLLAVRRVTENRGNPVIANLVQIQKITQVTVGDRHQQLYRFRGAVDALNSASMMGRREAFSDSELQIWAGSRLCGQRHSVVQRGNDSSTRLGPAHAGKTSIT
ncbi:hypothetical protein ALP74_200302 [Pseudomonas coronafaciens pv. garcae]|uniref:Reverse transcriptase N-terminal domain-containing protein n=1 Tax=Pseudomonas coronafaciens pv. garcae TaxID=251653 RepID=A0AB37QUP6_9PSED|nr:hypothetical protein ALP74_200302 [Pseudomonas coronafaciens pv. garcae]